MLNSFKKKKKEQADHRGGLLLQIQVMRDMRNSKDEDEPDKDDKPAKPGKRAKLFGKGPY